ncbi:MAG: VCBS repeat-containing protein [Bacteroidales bacterium]|nr:VCBS repeat-containing protein [Bacteroidales bacterium]
MTFTRSLRFTGPAFALATLILVSSCSENKTLFEEIDPAYSGIEFNNLIIESDSVNQLDNGNVYNGGGVGIGDFNNDSLPDIFFTGNLVECRLYLNEGDLRFRDVTHEAGVTGEGRWCRGVAVVDINNDGLDDIYVSATISSSAERRRNILYINTGTGSDGIPRFTDMAREYRLADDSHTTQAAFFDYDNDGDLDVYLVVNEINERDAPYVFRPLSTDGTGISTGKLFRNDHDTLKGHPVYTDVSAEAGIGTEGFGNQATVCDINEDGWKDIYVSNDYLSPDLLWINNRDGSFSEQLSHFFKHTSNSAMGNDAADINNDGLIDFVTLDMNPEDNYRKKMMLLPSSYQFYQNSERFGYNFQYTRNTLQVNQGRRILGNDSIGDPVFSEIAYFAGIEATDWSWTSLLADFDNDGYRDLFIGNGFPRDITDRDFGMFRMKAWLTTPKMEILKQVPEVKIHNYLYRNNGNLTFTNVSQEWGLSEPTFSNGAAYADLDNDGDADLVVNNINDMASLYRNKTAETGGASSGFLKVALRGDAKNLKGLGAKVEVFHDGGKKQVWENNPYRGYLSTVETTALFGLGSSERADSVKVKWSDGRTGIRRDARAGSVLVFDHTDAVPGKQSLETRMPLFTDITYASGITHTDDETDFADFNIQKLIPHKFSEPGPRLAAGDINGDGLDDLVAGGSARQSAVLFFQKRDATFVPRELLSKDEAAGKVADDAGILLFDVENDGDNDIYIASGGYENEAGSEAYSDRLYINNGKGIFTEMSEALPVNRESKGCVAAADYDGDGDMDLFVSGRVKPWSYPMPVTSCIYRNDSGKGVLKFTDVTDSAAPELKNIGMVCDVLFSDFTGDGKPDLVLAGEWMPLTFLENVNGSFKNVTSVTNPGLQAGWWNSLAEADFDKDGDTDYVAGNLGLNSYYRTSEAYPAAIYAGDFDNDGTIDAFPSLWLKTSQADTVFREYPAFGRDDIVKQMISMRSRFQNYKSLAVATIEKLLPPEQFSKAYILKATEFRSSLFINQGNGTFRTVPLPLQAQLSPLRDIITGDFNGDGNTDILAATNEFGTEVLTGRYDALNGLLLAGDGKGEFRALTIAESGIYIPGNGRSVVSLKSATGKLLAAASQNRGPLKLFRLNRE